MTTNSERLEAIRKLTDELKQGTLHGPIPTKTTMQLVMDIDFLLDLLTRARQDAEQMKQGISEAIRLIHTEDDYDAGMRLLCKLIGREDKWPKDMKTITVHEVAARAARDKETG